VTERESVTNSPPYVCDALDVDPLSDIVGALRVTGTLGSRLEAGGDWALRFAGYRHLKFGVVQTGSCWVTPAEGAAPTRLTAGDCYLLAAGAPYVLAARPGLQAEDGDARFRRASRDGVLRIAAAPDLVLDGGTLTFDADGAAPLLLHALPTALVVRDDAACAATIAMLAEEGDREPPGTAVVREGLSHVLFVQMLRAHVGHPGARAGWLGALADPVVARALRRIHETPQRAWRVPELADAAGLSRSAFAARFRRRVGVPPAEYALRWRMHHAAAALREPGASVGAVARAHGYASHASFSKAYKQVMGSAPSHARRAP
jgi:AraC-like DNA-binding protein